MDVKKVPDAELESFLDGAFIVIAALSEKSQNNRIGRICKRKNILFNNASGERGDLIIPAVSSGKRYMVAVSTEGRSPAVSRFIREHIGATFSRLDDMILLQDAVRTDLKKTKIPQQRRSAILSSMLRDPEIWDALECSLAEAEKSVRRKYIHA
jgi:precorrin-2 dehydrogenase/sirohydrochlorin ferrochelatase